MDNVYKVIFSPWISQEKITTAVDCKRENTIYCSYYDNKGGAEYTALFNEKTKEFLWADSRPLVGMKMFGVSTYVQPIAFSIRFGVQLAKFPYQVGKIFYESTRGFCKDVSEFRFKDAIIDRIILDLLVGLVVEVVTRAFKIIRLIWFTVGMSIAAFVGFTISPDIGKRSYSLIESDLNGGKKYAFPKSFEAFAKETFHNETLWLAGCPHPYGTLNDTYEDEDGNKALRYEILNKSKVRADIIEGEDKEQPRDYCVFPLIPCCS